MGKLSYVIILCSLYIFHTETIYAQSYFPERNGISLKGVTEFDAKASITGWLNVEGDFDKFHLDLQTAFQSALRGDGVVIDKNAPNYLFCEITVAQVNEIVMYKFQVLFYEFNSNSLNQLLWSDGGIATVEREGFSYQSVAQDCKDVFSREWLKQNPRR